MINQWENVTNIMCDQEFELLCIKEGSRVLEESKINQVTYFIDYNINKWTWNTISLFLNLYRSKKRLKKGKTKLIKKSNNFVNHVLKKSCKIRLFFVILRIIFF